jgi:penicillin amidase
MRERHSAADFEAMQTDRLSLMVQDFLPLMLAAPLSARGERVRPLLAAWDARMDAERPEPLLFSAWYRALTVRVFGDELGEDLARYHQRRTLAMYRMLTQETVWCDDVATPQAETCEARIAVALDDALDWLEAARYGDDPSAWRWGVAHQAISRHAVFSSVPLLRDLFEVRRAHGGGSNTVMQANTRIADEKAPFTEVHGASLRTIFDLADPDSTRAIVHTGQSGHRMSRHYDDLADRWLAGETLALPLTRAAVEAQTVHRLLLVPKKR